MRDLGLGLQGARQPVDRRAAGAHLQRLGITSDQLAGRSLFVVDVEDVWHTELRRDARTAR